MLEQIFIELVARNSSEKNAHGYGQIFWQEIRAAYGSRARHYHTLAHLENMFYELENVRSNIADWDALLFALFYHDFVYDVLRKDNEWKSAMLAEKQLTTLGFAPERISLCKAHILATQHHAAAEHPDTHFFLDADLSILGAVWKTYFDYTQQVRAEYAIYPDLLYRPGRRKVLAHFLKMEQIFKTDFFQEKFETTARKNLKQELDLLT